ncbi:MAG: hypothetical protein K8H88_20245 [Sandaracinaceae bacterium]|nr:hypothetical protein [Sandaracinaceae bacterium]
MRILASLWIALVATFLSCGPGPTPTPPDPINTVGTTEWCQARVSERPTDDRCRACSSNPECGYCNPGNDCMAASSTGCSEALALDPDACPAIPVPPESAGGESASEPAGEVKP